MTTRSRKRKTPRTLEEIEYEMNIEHHAIRFAKSIFYNTNEWSLQKRLMLMFLVYGAPYKATFEAVENTFGPFGFPLSVAEMEGRDVLKHRLVRCFGWPLEWPIAPKHQLNQWMQDWACTLRAFIQDAARFPVDCTRADSGTWATTMDIFLAIQKMRSLREQIHENHPIHEVLERYDEGSTDPERVPQTQQTQCTNVD